MRTRYGFSLAIILLMIGPAWADKAPVLPQPDPEGYWRLVTHDDATTTSQCIGDLSNPICTIESDLLAWERGNTELFYKTVGKKVPPGEKIPSSGQHEFEKYRFVSFGNHLKDMPRHDDMPPEITWKSGDIWAIVDNRECYQYFSEHPCNDVDPSDPQGHLRRYILRHIHGQWIIIATRPLSWHY